MKGTHYFLLFILGLTACSEKPRESNSQRIDSDFYFAENGTPYTGTKVIYFDDGKKKELKSYTQGKLDGEHVLWLDNGHEKVKESFRNGKRTDLYIGWHNNGLKKEEGLYIDGKRYGMWTWWNEKGEKTYEICYGFDC